MRIVHHFTILERGGGGVPRAMLDLAAGLAAAGEDVMVAAAAGCEKAKAEAVVDGVEFAWLAPPRALRPLLSLDDRRKMKALLRGAEVLHLHGLWRPRNRQLSRIAERLGLPVVVSLHGMLNPWALAQGSRWKRVYLRFVERRTLRAAARIHFAAQRELEQAKPRLPHQRTAVIPLAVDLAGYRDLGGAEPFWSRRPDLRAERGAHGMPTVLMLSRLHPGKRAEIAIRSVERLNRTGTPCRLFLAGEGEPEYVGTLRRLVDDLGAGDRVRFLGLVTGSEKHALFQAADVFALPTVGENFGLVLFEALASGTPVLTTRGADTWREIEASGGGLVVPRDDESLGSSFAEHLRELLGNRSRREAMGRRGRDWVFRELDSARLIERYRGLYRDVSGFSGRSAT